MNLKLFGTTTLLICMASLTTAQTVHHHEINTAIAPKKIYTDKLKLGGKSSKGDEIDVNSYYVSVNKKPFIPIAGEFHYSRYPSQYWDESIKKMKAGGINVIATYVFWNMVEEKQGRYNFEGSNNLREFIELCAANDIYVIVRIGPFDHGEIRNGGLPDWLLGKPLMVRSNDPLYLSYVEKLYDEIGKQLKGLYFKDNGPVIGTQIENEYQHSAAPWGLTYPGQPYDMTASERDQGVTHEGVSVAEGANPYAELGNDHMKVLKSLAIKAGMDTPLYTATGWGYAAIIPNESLPVTAAYAYPFWTDKKDLSPFFLYKDMHALPDYAPVRYTPQDYPAFAAELGSGIMSVYSRRPIAEHKSFDAMINRCLGSGCNGIGYYMYHGGSTAKGATYFNDEAYGLPKISYDFQAPIGEYGQVREGYHRLKLLHYFIGEFGQTLAPMATILPEGNDKITPENLSSLRYAVRAKGNSGFLFVNNFQDDAEVADKKDISIKIKTGKGAVTIPAEGGFAIKGGENAMFPYNFDLNGSNLIYATAQLLTKGTDGKMPYYVFFKPEGVAAEFLFEDKGIQVEAGQGTVNKKGKNIWVTCPADTTQFTIITKGKKTTVLVLTKAMALTATQVAINGQRHLLFADGVALQDGASVSILSGAAHNFTVSVYPKITTGVSTRTGTVSVDNSGGVFTVVSVNQPKKTFAVTTKKIGEQKYTLQLPASLDGLNDVLLQVKYKADTAMGFLDGELVTDEFYKGIPWQIGLRKFMPQSAGREMVLYFRPLHKDATYLNDLRPEDVPDFGDESTLLSVDDISFIPQYQTILDFKK